MFTLAVDQNNSYQRMSSIVTLSFNNYLLSLCSGGMQAKGERCRCTTRGAQQK